MTAKIFHPLLALIASASSNELAKYVEFLKEENKILRARIPGQVHTKPDERSRLIKLGRALGQAIEELITLVAPSTFYRWCREADAGKRKPNPKGGQRKSREIREFVIEIAKTCSVLLCWLGASWHHFEKRHTLPNTALQDAPTDLIPPVRSPVRQCIHSPP